MAISHQIRRLISFDVRLISFAFDPPQLVRGDMYFCCGGAGLIVLMLN
jgi:hypothetical protein